MQGPNGALVPGPGGSHSSAQNNQSLDNELGNQGNMGRGFDQGNVGMGQGNLGQGFDNAAGSNGYGSGTRPVLKFTALQLKFAACHCAVACISCTQSILSVQLAVPAESHFPA